MAYNKYNVLKDNLEAIESALSGKNDIEKLRKYNGFGGIKSLLLNPEDVSVFPENDKALIPLVSNLHELLRSYSKDDNEYKRYFDSIRLSVLTSFYTPKEIVDTINQAFQDNNISFNKLLDPSAGSGVFLNIDSNEKTAFEKDILTGKILKALYPDHEIYISGFENAPRSIEGSFDLVASNIPFGDIKVFDPVFFNSKIKEKKQSCGHIHNYFFLKSADMLQEGGVMALITSTGVMDAPSHDAIRKYLLKGNRLISAVRLPENLFTQIAGTEVQSDLIILQKDSQREQKLNRKEEDFLKISPFAEAKINSYYADLKSVVQTNTRFDKNLYGQPDIRFTHSGGVKGIAEDLAKIIQKDIANNINTSLLKTVRPKIEKRSVSIGSTQLSLFDDAEDYFKPQKPVIPKPEPSPKKEKVKFEYSKKEYLKPGNFILSKDGDTIGIIDREYQGIQINFNLFDRDIVKNYIQVRDAYYELERNEYTTSLEYPELRKELNDVYDGFVSQFGSINQNKSALDKDFSFKEIRTLEYFVDGIAQKADIFFEPISFSKKKESYTIEEAYFSSLNEYNSINLDYIISLTGNSKDEIVNELKNEIFFNPVIDNYEPAYIFLSGNVIEKYNKISLLADENSNSEITKSLEALREVMPVKIPFEDIGLNFGERWIPEKYYIDYATNIFGSKLKIIYSNLNDTFVIGDPEGPLNLKYQVVSQNGITYTPMDVFRFALIDNIPDMTVTVGTGILQKTIPDVEGIQKMNIAIESIKSQFKDFLFELPEKDKQFLENLYNERFNCFVKAKYDGSFQNFPDLNLKNLGYSEVRKSQKDAILMIKCNNGGVIDHEVGNGKSLIMVVSAYELKRLGIANKPIILALKANVIDIAETYKKAYPHAKILSSTDEDMSPAQRIDFYSKIKNNNWHAVIMTHDQFAKIPQSPEIQVKFVDEELIKLSNAKKDLENIDGRQKRKVEKALVKQENNLKTKLKELQLEINTKKDTEILNFETMGFDHVELDESHKFKNLYFTTKHTRVAGIGNNTGSQRSLNMLMAIRTIQARTGKDLGATFLSGTTITNSLTELYNIFNYLRPQALKKQGIFSFDAWAATYTLKTKDFEFNVVNRIVQKERFRYFVKVPELAMFYSEITDYKTAKDANIDKPEVNEIFISLDRTPDQIDMFNRLQEFAVSGHGDIIFREPLSDKEKAAKMLIATNTAKKASLDMRLIDESMFGDDAGNKTSASAEKVYENYIKYAHVKGTQFIFCDLGTYKNDKEFNVYNDIKKKLIKKGVPEHEIQFIHKNNTDKKRLKLWEKMNNGSVRVTIGSTEMLGTGVNAQERIVAMHHIDIPWRPSDLDQRNGRGARVGNWVARDVAGNVVDTYIYATKQSLDNYKFNLLKTKATFISQIKNQTISVRMIDEGGLDENSGMNHSEYIAILSGNTDILDKSRLEKQIAQLKSEEQIFQKELRRIQSIKAQYHNQITNLNKEIDKFKNDKQAFELFPRNEAGEIIFKMKIEGKEFTNPIEAGEKLYNIISRVSADTSYKNVGSVYGFDLLKKVDMYRPINSNEYKYDNKLFVSRDEIKYCYNFGNLASDPKLAAANPFKALEKIDELLLKYESERDYKQKALDVMKNDGIETEFPKKKELEELNIQLTELNTRIENSLKEIDEQNKVDENLSLTEQRSPQKDDFRI